MGVVGMPATPFLFLPYYAIFCRTRAISSVVERFIDIEEVGSSILPSRTNVFKNH